jgi:hypothetical protein
LDVVGHEIAHGVTEHAANLVYQGEPGALNESFSDIFGAAVEFFAEGSKGDWLIGEDIYDGQGAMRSMENPNRFRDPDTYLGRYWIDTDVRDDFGGVHTNSGVQNHWFYLLSEGGAGMNDDQFTYEVEGIGWEDATSIAYRNLTLYLVPESRYKDAARYSIQSAEDLFGTDSPQVESTRAAWEAVGIYMGPNLMSNDTLLQFETPVGRSDSLETTLLNKGLQPLTISGFQLSDTLHYRVVNPTALPMEIGDFEQLLMEVKFTPSFEGIHPGTLTITGSGSGDFEKTIDLSGKGLASTTGLTETVNSNAAGITLYPNPVRNLMTIETNISDLYSIELLAINGQLLLQEEMSGSVATLDLSHLQKGVYFIHIRSRELVLTRKIIKL